MINCLTLTLTIVRPGSTKRKRKTGHPLTHIAELHEDAALVGTHSSSNTGYNQYRQQAKVALQSKFQALSTHSDVHVGCLSITSHYISHYTGRNDVDT